MSRDSEIRRMSLLKSNGISPFSVLNLALEVLKAKAAEITVPAIFATAGDIVMHLPSLKNTVDAINLATAKEAEKWVVGNDIPAPASAPAPTPAAATGTLPEPVAISVDFAAPEPEPEEEAPTPVEKDDLTITGEIAAVSKTGKGVRIGDVWYNVTTRTKKNVEPEKGKTVKIKYVQGNSGFLVETIDPA